MGHISESKSNNQLPSFGTLCKITDEILPEEECIGFSVKQKHIECRKPSINGVYRGWVPGAYGGLNTKMVQWVLICMMK